MDKSIANLSVPLGQLKEEVLVRLTDLGIRVHYLSVGSNSSCGISSGRDYSILADAAKCY